MKQNQAKKPMSESEIQRAFEALGIASHEQRAQLLANTIPPKQQPPAKKEKPEAWLSNSSEPSFPR